MTETHWRTEEGLQAIEIMGWPIIDDGNNGPEVLQFHRVAGFYLAYPEPPDPSDFEYKSDEFISDSHAGALLIKHAMEWLWIKNRDLTIERIPAGWIVYWQEVNQPQQTAHIGDELCEALIKAVLAAGGEK